MKSSWLSNQQAKEHVGTILEQAGTLLELKVAGICEKFCKSHTKPKQIFVTTENLVYATPVNNPLEEIYREVDQRVQIYNEIEVSESIGVQLIVDLPVECKCRKGLELFAFSHISKLKNILEFPIFGSFAGSGYFERLKKTYDTFSHLKMSKIVPLQIENTSSIKRSDEQLEYKAGSSLYDFIHFTEMGWHGEAETAKELLKSLAIFPELKKYLQNREWHKVHNWLKQLNTKQCEAFNKSFSNGQCIYYSIKAYLPIVCFNGPLYQVLVNKKLNIENYAPLTYAITSIRKSGWPGLLRASLLSRTAEAPILVTNAEGLPSCLEIGYQWYEAILNEVVSAPRSLLERWPLESAIMRYYKMEQYYKGTKGFSSDIDGYEDLEIHGWTIPV